ncbi:hypothetical protein NL425_27355, partial [Klebsiella pneumoniae]|nr:hypothetical protein [Klebsiella pneumoniae]
FSATISLESAADRNNGVLAQNPFLPLGNEDLSAGISATDIVGNVKYAGTWGEAQISGALHQTNSVNVLNQFTTQDTWGYAL